jgi:hypothetical protein
MLRAYPGVWGWSAPHPQNNRHSPACRNGAARVSPHSTSTSRPSSQLGPRRASALRAGSDRGRRERRRLRVRPNRTHRHHARLSAGAINETPLGQPQRDLDRLGYCSGVLTVNGATPNERSPAGRQFSSTLVPKPSQCWALITHTHGPYNHADTYCRASATASSSVSPAPALCSTSYAAPRRSRALDIKRS